MNRLRIPKTRGEPPLPVLATCFEVVGTRGKRRMVLLVSCPWCRRIHQHGATDDFLIVRRTASCHEGRYALHIGSIERAA